MHRARNPPASQAIFLPKEPAINQPRKRKEKKNGHPPAESAVRVKMYPTAEQRITLRKWLGTVRWIYNAALVAVRDKVVPLNITLLRQRFVNEDSVTVQENPWMKEVPYDVRDDALRDLLKAFWSNMEKKKLNPQHTFELKFRTRKDRSETFTLHAKHWRNGEFYPKSFGRHVVKYAERLPQAEKMVYDMRVQRTRLGDYYLCVPQPRVSRDENQVPRPMPRVIALDPGVRSFVTGYDPSGNIVEIGVKDISRIYRLCHAADKLSSKISNATKARQRYSMRRARLRIFQKIRDLTTDLHRRLAKWLCTEYDTILLPKFETAQMVLKHKRRIRSQTARQMLSWSHYKFKQQLLHKSHEFAGRHVEIVTEEYTTKTCGKCGAIHSKIGGNKVFACPQCACRMDRDWNGARNIYLKNAERRVGAYPLPGQNDWSGRNIDHA
jgi:putative transposase